MTGALTAEVMEVNGPLVNVAAVRVYGRAEDTSTFTMCRYTDENGLSEPIFLPVPSNMHPMQSSPQVCPYAAYDVYATKDDYNKEATNGVQILPDTTPSLRVIVQYRNGRLPKTNMI